ncbi:N-acetyltransferase [Croceicoccus sp. F390]|uniref:N-acetyltransferase n=1 Tax=Croceicoccus esteveae TaxID=3075597 RepID=A0ABU2ZEH4_9SPHN|nr:N-acetyltransferase [Croceicoccus sp. F390]MDT0575008.1 N-acetyltransferase [Croceicoccus sp. F390]
MASIIPLSNVETGMIEDLLDLAFDPQRQRRTAYLVREGMDWLPALSFAALDDEEMLTGTIQCWPVGLTDPAGRVHPLVMVGPVAVVPGAQNTGFGRMLMLTALKALSETSGARGPLPQVLVGDPAYYGRFFGFVADHTAGWRLPGPYDPARLLCRTANPLVLPTHGMLGPWTRAVPSVQ